MEKNYRSAVAQHPVGNFGVPALDALHGADLITEPVEMSRVGIAGSRCWFAVAGSELLIRMRFVSGTTSVVP
jgi:hypothetical protein